MSSEISDETNDIDDGVDADVTAVSTQRRGKAWRPESDAEVAGLLRRLATTPWLVGDRDDDLIAAVRRNEPALRATVARLGWVLVVERDLVRLRKSAPPRPGPWARGGPSPASCSWFFLLVAAAESMPSVVALGALVTAARSTAAEAGLPSSNDMGERRAIVAALRMLDERGVVERLDGDLDGYLHDDQAPVLLAVHHTRLAHVVANPGTLDPAADPLAWLEQVRREPDPARRMRRALVDDACVHTAFLDEPEAQWMSHRVRGDDGAPLAAAFGLILERRAEGAAFVVPDEAYRHFRELGPMAFPAWNCRARGAAVVRPRGHSRRHHRWAWHRLARYDARTGADRAGRFRLRKWHRQGRLGRRVCRRPRASRTHGRRSVGWHQPRPLHRRDGRRPSRRRRR